MKGTLYSADFIKSPSGDLKLIELNTDTDFTKGTLQSAINFDGFADIIVSQSITEVHVIHKKIHNHIVDSISQSLSANVLYSGSFTTTEESSTTIYPTDVPDSDTKFVLRMAYNESAIFDSVYCKGVTNLFKLFTDNSDSGSVINHYISASDEGYYFNNLENTFNGNLVPDVVWKADLETTEERTRKFIKIGKSELSDSDRYSQFLSSQAGDGDVITNYIDTSNGTDYMKSIRFCNIIYDTDLKNLVCGAYEIDALFDKPTGSIGYDETVLVNDVPQKHYFEFATNYYKFDYKTQGGIFESTLLQKPDGTFVSASDSVVGERYQSLHISGSSNSDIMEEVLEWYSTGSSLPLDSYFTSSVLISSESHNIIYNIIPEINISGSDAEFMLGPSTLVLVHDQAQNVVKYKRVYDLDSTIDSFLGTSGSLVPIEEINMAVLDGDYKTYEFDVEDADTFIMNDVGVRIVGHNIKYGAFTATCFVAGTMITMADGSQKDIVDVKKGDMVLSYDLSTKGFVEKEVLATDDSHTVGDHESSCNKLGDGCGVYHFLGMEDFRFTPEHPFLLEDGKWASLDQLTDQEPWKSEQSELVTLKEGDVLIKKDGKFNVNKIIFKPMDASTKVYNLTIADTHTYIAHGFIVHNK